MRSVVHDDENRASDDTRRMLISARERIEAAYGREVVWKALGPGRDEA